VDFSDYQDKCNNTAHYPKEQGLEYTALGLVGEAGEIANKTKKVIRGDYPKNDLRKMLIGEIGDVLWYCAVLATELNLDLGQIARLNIDKLADRQKRGVIKGSGDNR
jgi:NTP pyrophosphatase (non-canonical NTP hydrolase)